MREQWGRGKYQQLLESQQDPIKPPMSAHPSRKRRLHRGGCRLQAAKCRVQNANLKSGNAKYSTLGMRHSRPGKTGTLLNLTGYLAKVSFEIPNFNKIHCMELLCSGVVLVSRRTLDGKERIH